MYISVLPDGLTIIMYAVFICFIKDVNKKLLMQRIATSNCVAKWHTYTGINMIEDSFIDGLPATRLCWQPRVDQVAKLMVNPEP